MLSTAIIIFREVLEAALIVSIVMAATRGVSYRGSWVLAGIAGGILGAVIVAGFADQIAQAMEGVGQELFNAGVLLAAVVMLGWHNVWMERHGKALAQEMTSVGDAVASGARPLYALAIVVGLAVLREGSEVVLFTYGIASGGVGMPDIAAGAAVGLALGAAVGMALYFGLLRIPTKHLFKVTSWMILLLAAGMASQAAKFLNQADMVPALGHALWDSSFLLAEEGAVGQVLHTLIGYVARPSGIQLVFYIATLVIIGGLMRLSTLGKLNSKPVIAGALFVAVAGGVGLTSGRAEAGVKVYSPSVEQGEVEIEYIGYITDDNNSALDNEQRHQVGIGYGVTEYWYTEIYGQWNRAPGDHLEFSATEFENRFQLTEPGEYWVDVGLLTEYVLRNGGKADKIEFGPLFEKEIGRTTNTVNLVFEREIGSGRDHSVGFEYAIATRYRWIPEFEPGIEVFGALGPVNNFHSPDDQEHKMGPVAKGSFSIDGIPGKIGYDVGYLFGLTQASADGTLKWVLEYEFRF